MIGKYNLAECNVFQPFHLETWLWEITVLSLRRAQWLHILQCTAVSSQYIQKSVHRTHVSALKEFACPYFVVAR